MKNHHNNNSIWRIWRIMAAALILLSSCEKEPDPKPDPDPDPDIPADILLLNNWIWEGMSEVYLWEAFMPNLDPNKEPDPREFFDKLLYDDDIYSWIVDDYDALVAQLQGGVELTTGMSAYHRLIEGDQVISIVNYVTPGSPAADSGVVRGDIIMTIDGQYLDKDNYWELNHQTTATYVFGTWDGTYMVPTGKVVTLTAIELSQNPVVHSEIIEYEGEKIGYFVYTQFTAGESEEWIVELNNVFESFKTAAVTDVVVDLRYNGGGLLGLSAYMASTLGSATAMNANDVYVKLVWNDLYNQYWRESDLDEDGNPDGEDSPQLVIKLPPSDLNLNLSKVYFLTTDWTASASESLMVGLYPYINVVQIGTTTYGKCYGSFTVDDWHVPKRHNWAMQPIILKYANAEGYTDFVDGIIPDYYIEEQLLDLKSFGSYEDPILAKALEDITGIAPVVKKSVQPDVDLSPLPRPRKQIPEMIIDWPEKPGKRIIY
ncbi:MAG: S41 family peptidase [Bacteroidota bacterium]